MIAFPLEFHLSFRVADLEESTAFYAGFLGVEPKDRTQRFSTFIVPELKLNLVLLVNDSGEERDWAVGGRVGPECVHEAPRSR